MLTTRDLIRIPLGDIDVLRGVGGLFFLNPL
jgi:hypothetical protein